MEYVVAFDYAACAILSVTIFCSVFRRIYRTESGRFFITLCSFMMVTAIFDVLATYNFGIMYLWVMSGLYLLFRSLTPFFYALYLISLTSTVHRISENWKLAVILSLPLLINFGFLATNPIHKMFFTISDAGVYSRGPFIFIQYGMSALYLVVGVIYIAKYSRYFSTLKIICLYSFYLATAITLVVQYFFPNLLVEIFANSASLLFYLIMLHRPEEWLDSRTGCENEGSFLLTMRRDIDLKKHTYVILGHLYNYRSLDTLYDTKSSATLLKTIGKRFKTIGKGFGLRATYYTTGKGDANVIFHCKNKKRATSFAHAVEDFLQSDLSDGTGRFRGKAKTVLLHQPYDFNNYEAFVYFAAHYWQFPQLKGDVVFLNDYREMNGFQSLMDINSILKDAIENKTFDVFYQPIYSVKEKRFTTCEALVRLKNEKYGFIPPDFFVPFAERYGLITDITDVVIDKVVEFVGSYDFNRLGLESVEINLSIADCLDDTLMDRLLTKIENHNVNPSFLNFEVTETYTTDQRAEVTEFLEQLSSHGFKLSLDDFGTGYSNFGRLADLPFTMLKMDRSIVQKRDYPKMKKIIPTIVSVGRTLGDKIVIEGIETEEELRVFEDYGVDYVQGYYFSRPLPKDQFIELVSERNK